MNDMPTLDVDQPAEAAVEAARRYVRAGAGRLPGGRDAEGRVDAALVEAGSARCTASPGSRRRSKALAQLAAWARRLATAGRLGAGEDLVLRIGFGEYLAQLLGGLPMSQNEMVRPGRPRGGGRGRALRQDAAVRWFLRDGNTAGHAPNWPRLLAEGWRPTTRWATRRWTWCATSSASSPTSGSRRTPMRGTWQTR